MFQMGPQAGYSPKKEVLKILGSNSVKCYKIYYYSGFLAYNVELEGKIIATARSAVKAWDIAYGYILDRKHE